MKSPVILTITIGLCVFIGICPVNSQNDVSGNTEEVEACKYGCPAIVDNTLITSCQDDDGEVSTCTECQDTDTVATLSCKPGYERTPDPGYNQTTCETNGTGSNWSIPVFSCTPKIPADGNTEEDEACKYGCQAIVDNTLITSCQDDDGEVTTCTECQDSYTVATLSCKPGYEIIPDPGYNKTTCKTHGTGSNWSKPVFSCTPKIPDFNAAVACVFGCPPISDVTLNPTCRLGNDVIDCNTCLPVGTVVSLTCANNYRVVPDPGYDTAECGATSAGEWSKPLYSCNREVATSAEPLVNTDLCGYNSASGVLDVRSFNNKNNNDNNNNNNNNINQLPWMALLKYTSQKGRKTTDLYSCAGSLVSDRYVLTAANCVAFLKSTLLLTGVRLGVQDYNSTVTCLGNCPGRPRDVAIESTIVHPGYERMTMRDNVALLRLAESIDFNTGNARPICLPVGVEEKSRSFNGEHLIVAGWGLENKPTKSSLLQQLTLPIVSQEECTKKHFTPGRNHQTNITGAQSCVGGASLRDSCVGDAGGPLIQLGIGQLRQNMVQYGIGWAEPRCNKKAVPNIFTKVAPYVDWILENLRD